MCVLLWDTVTIKGANQVRQIYLWWLLTWPACRQCLWWFKQQYMSCIGYALCSSSIMWQSIRYYSLLTNYYLWSSLWDLPQKEKHFLFVFGHYRLPWETHFIVISDCKNYALLSQKRIFSMFSWYPRIKKLLHIFCKIIWGFVWCWWSSCSVKYMHAYSCRKPWWMAMVRPGSSIFPWWDWSCYCHIWSRLL